MRAVLIISSLVVLASARPDVSLGYKYDSPPDNYQGAVPEQGGSISGSSSFVPVEETLPNFVPVQGHSGPALPPVYPDAQQPDNFIPTGPSDVQLQGVPSFAPSAVGQQTDISDQALTTGSESYRNSNDQQQKLLASSYEATPSGTPPPQQPERQEQILQRSSVSSNYQQQQSVSSSSSFSQSSDELPPIITKHFYVHAAPEEPEESEGPRFVNIGRKQKNYKIIFIKAPTYGFNSQVIPIVQPNEEKTIVYVLSKKPSYNQDISLPPVPVTEPSKPEVFFIKYKTDKEAQDAQQQIQGAYDSSAFKGSNDEISSIANIASGGQISGSSSFVDNVAQIQTENNEQHEAASASDNTFSANLVEAQLPVEQPALQLSQPLQSDSHEKYLPPTK